MPRFFPSIIERIRFKVIYYTLDGRTPASTAGNGTCLYQKSLSVYWTTCIRSKAVLSADSSNHVVTQTYFFINDILKQTSQTTINAGFPQKWGQLKPDYGLDPDIVNRPEYADLLDDSFLALPATVTRIPNRVAGKSEVTIIIYNIGGQEIARLVEGEHLPGLHSAEWDASRCPNGLYFARMKAGNFCTTIKLIVLK